MAHEPVKCPHAECEAAYRQRWGDKIIISSQEVATAVTPRGEADDFD